MERTVGTFGLADFYAGQKRNRPNFLDAISVLIKWEPIEKCIKKKWDAKMKMLLASKPIPPWSCSRCCYDSRGTTSVMPIWSSRYTTGFPFAVLQGFR